MIIRLYVVIALGLFVIRSPSVIVDTLDGLGDRYARSRGWVKQYDHLRQLLPTLRACLEYALWIALASLVLVQLPPTRDIAAWWGPRLIEAIGILCAGRVIVELGRLEIGHRMLPREGQSAAGAPRWCRSSGAPSATARTSARPSSFLAYLVSTRCHSLPAPACSVSSSGSERSP